MKIEASVRESYYTRIKTHTHLRPLLFTESHIISGHMTFYRQSRNTFVRDLSRLSEHCKLTMNFVTTNLRKLVQIKTKRSVLCKNLTHSKNKTFQISLYYLFKVISTHYLQAITKFYGKLKTNF